MPDPTRDEKHLLIRSSSATAGGRTPRHACNTRQFGASITKESSADRHALLLSAVLGNRFGPHSHLLHGFCALLPRRQHGGDTCTCLVLGTTYCRYGGEIDSTPASWHFGCCFA